MIIDLFEDEVVHFNDTGRGLRHWHAPGWWEFVPAACGRVNPLGPADMIGVFEAEEGYTGFGAMIDNPLDIRATSPLFAPIAAARRVRERKTFVYGLRPGSPVEAVWPHLCEDDAYHFFPGTICSFTGLDLRRVVVEFSSMGMGPGPFAELRLGDVRAPVHELTGNSVVPGWVPYN